VRVWGQRTQVKEGEKKIEMRVKEVLVKYEGKGAEKKEMWMLMRIR